MSLHLKDNVVSCKRKCPLSLSFFFFFFFLTFRATLVAYGHFQARGGIRATAAALHHSHSNAIFRPRFPPTLQLVAMSDP